MANSDPLDIFQPLADFDSAFYEEFVRLKIDPPGREVDRSELYRRDGAVLGNLQDDAIRRVVKSIPRRAYDNRQSIASALREPPGASALAIASVANGGGTGDFTIAARIADGQLLWLRLVSVGGLTAAVDLALYVNAARTKPIAIWTAVDPSTAFVDSQPVAVCHNGTPGSPGDGEQLENRTIYGRITNNGAAASPFTLEAILEGI